MGRRQRHHRQRHARAPAALRHGLRPLSGHRREQRRGPRRRRHGGQGLRRARPGQPAVGRPRRRRRPGVHRLLHGSRRRGQAPGGGCQEGRHLRAGQGRGHHRGARRQLRQVRQGGARRHLQRLVHDQLPGAVRQGRPRVRRHQARPHDDHPRLHRRPAPPGRAALRPPPRPRCRHEPRADLDRRGQGRRPRAARAQRQAPRLQHPRARHHRLGRRPHLRGGTRDQRRRAQRRLQGGGRGRPEGHPAVQRGPDRLDRHHRRRRTPRSSTRRSPR